MGSMPSTPEFTGSTVPLPSTATEPCEDNTITYPNCAMNKGNGKCAKGSDIYAEMVQNCKKTCGFCSDMTSTSMTSDTSMSPGSTMTPHSTTSDTTMSTGSTMMPPSTTSDKST